MRLPGLLTDNRFWPLFMKELRQIGRNRKLVVMLISADGQLGLSASR